MMAIKFFVLAAMPSSTTTKPPRGISIIESKRFAWWSVTRQSEKVIAELHRRFPFILENDLRELQPPFQRPKLLERDGYLFLVLLFPVEVPGGEIKHTEVDFLIGSDFVITNHTGDLPELEQLVRAKNNITEQVIANSSERLAYHVIHTVLTSRFPLLTQISNKIMALEPTMFSQMSEQSLVEVLRLKSQVVDFRKTLQGHRQAIIKLSERRKMIFGRADSMINYDDLLRHLEEMEGFLENDKVTLEAISTAQLSLVNFRTNQASQRLSAIALVVLPMTMVAAIFAMRAEHMPFVGGQWDFWIMMGFIFATMLVTVGYLRARDWL